MKFSLKVLSLLCVFLTSLVFAADKDDTFRELEEGKLTLNFLNAMDGSIISGANVKIDGIGEFQTDSLGKVYFQNPEKDGEYKVYFSKNGFVESEFFISLEAGSIFFNRFSISPALGVDEIRIVLDWDKRPDDLDLHLERNGSFHISYRNKKNIKSNEDIAQLDKDAKDGFGPETITLQKISSNGSYKVFVEDYSNKGDAKSKDISKSKAQVKVYTKNTLFKVFKVPNQRKGSVWEVFSIENSTIKEINLLK